MSDEPSNLAAMIKAAHEEANAAVTSLGANLSSFAPIRLVGKHYIFSVRKLGAK
jgi:hypothetical protein